MINGDPQLLDLIFTNLLSNAVKYSGNSHRVEVCIGRAGERATIVIRDYGVGIPTAEIPQLFSRFFRASTAKGIPGTGIGLNLAKELVVLHGGEIDVTSQLGQGTSFTVKLPIDGVQARETPVTAAL